MSSLTDHTLTGEALARRLVELRSVIVRKHHNVHRNHLSFEDVDDLYGRAVLVLLEKEPPAVFPSDRALRAWLEETMRRSILAHSRSWAARLSAITAPLDDLAPPLADGGVGKSRRGAAITQPASRGLTPEQQAMLDFEHDTIEEYIAGLSDTDRRIALLYLWPSSRMPARKIAATLGLPIREVQVCTQRIAMSWQRYTALSVGTVCRRQMQHLERWQHDGGQMPLQLSIHARRCSRCRQAILAARQRGYDALLPLVPALGLPAAGGGGPLAKPAAAAGHTVRRVTRPVAKLLPATKEGAGSALLAGKSAATVAVIATTATVSVATVGVVAVTTADHHSHRPVAAARVLTTTAPSSTAPQGTTSSQQATTAPTPTQTAQARAGAIPAPDSPAGGATDRRPGSAAGTTDATATTSSHSTSKQARATDPTVDSRPAGATSSTASPPAAPDQSSGEDSPSGKTLAAP